MEEIIQKLDECWALFQIHLLVTQDLWRPISTRKSVTVKLVHGSARLSSSNWRALQVATMSQARTVVHHVTGDRENECWTSLSHPAIYVWSVIAWQWLLINQTKPNNFKKGEFFYSNLPGRPWCCTSWPAPPWPLRTGRGWTGGSRSTRSGSRTPACRKKKISQTLPGWVF